MQKSVAGIFNAMRTNPKAWVDSSAPTGQELEGWKNEFGIDAMHYDDWSENPREKSNAMIFRWGALCFGHEYEDNVKLNGCKIHVYDIGEEVKALEQGEKLAYYIYKSVTEKDRGSSNITASRYAIREFLIKGGVSVQTPDNSNLINKDVSNKYEELKVEADKYYQERKNRKLEFRNNSKATITYKNGYTFIGPYNIGFGGGKLSKVSITDENNSSMETTLCSTNGIDIINLSDVEESSKPYYRDFYFVIKGKNLTSVSKIQLFQHYKYYKARIVMAYPQDGQGGQDVSIFYAYETTGTDEIDLPVPQYGDLEVVKQDADNEDKKIGNVGFKVKNSAGKYVKQDANGGITYVEENNATIFKTDDNGKITIKNLALGEYKIIETSNPNYGYTVMAEVNTTVKAGSNKCELKNEKQTGNLKIVKEDADTEKPMKGVGFKIRKKDSKYISVKAIEIENKETKYTWKTSCTGIIHVSDMQDAETKEKATTFITNKDGIIEIRNILKGEYEVEEFSLGDDVGDSYEIDNNYITWSYIQKPNKEIKGSGAGHNATVTVVRRWSINTENPPKEQDRNEVLTFKNKKKYIKLSGYVWEDMYYGKQSNHNNLYNEGQLAGENGSSVDDIDKRLNGIKVTLYKNDGTKIAETKTTTLTNSNNQKEEGRYIFKKVKIEDLSSAYIEFEYNGLKYQNVTINLNKDNGSKAIEKPADRNDFNKKLSTITADMKVEGCSLTYKYSEDDHMSTLNNSDKYVDDYKFNKIKADTDTAGLGLKELINSVLKEGRDEVENINLGLCLREQPDLAIVKDVYSAKLSINGYEHTYEYQNRFTDNEYDGFNITTKFETKYGNQSYTRAIYASDVQQTTDENFTLKVIYGIRISNQSTELYSRVNSLVEYYDSRYTIENASLGLDEHGNLDENKLISIIEEDTSSEINEKYHKATLELNQVEGENKSNDIVIEPEGDRVIYVQFNLSREEVGNIIFAENNNNTSTGLENIAEISSYTTFSKDEKGKLSLYAGVDKDSCPSNAKPGDRTTYEDDTDSAPGLKLEVADARKISGTVFLDKSVFNDNKPEETHTGETRNGNGIYDNGEETISGVKVELYKYEDIETDDDGNSSIKEGATPVGITTYNNAENVGTGKDGTFEISGFIPGEYKIVYTWGDGTYIEGDTNSPIDVNAYKGTIYNELDRQRRKDWYSYGSDKRYSDAMDNYRTRQAIDEPNSTITTMNSSTPSMEFGVELNDEIKKGSSNKTVESDEKGKVTFTIPNVDFGITERARQALDINKQVQSVKISLANGQTIVDAQVEEENGKYKLVGSTIRGVTYQGASADGIPINGFVKAEIDNELLQGSTLEVTYKISVKNNSEIDYMDNQYYLYGGEGNKEQKIKVKPSGVYDYLDNVMSYDKDKNEYEWTIVQINDNDDLFNTNPTIIENELSYASTSTDSDGTVTTITGYESSYEEYYSTIEEWSTENIATARTKRLANKTILNNKNLENDIEPGQENSVTLCTSKVLSTTDEIEINNDAEIVKVEQTAGRKITSHNCKLYDKGETITVTPPTGENKDYTSIIVIAISSFILLGIGIIFIKKKVI